jgi:hypothetical protein
MRRHRRRFFIAATALLTTLGVATPSFGSQGSNSPIGRSADRIGYQVLHTVPLPTGATRVASIPRGLMIVAGGEQRGTTNIDDLKEFFKVRDGASLVTWINERHTSRLTEYVEGASSWPSAHGRASSHDSLWSVTNPKIQMEVAFNANDVSSGPAYLRVDVYVYWSPQFMAVTGAAGRATLAVTNKVFAGYKTVHVPREEGFESTTCTYRIYRVVREPLETLNDTPRRLTTLERYVNTRSETTLGYIFGGTFETECDMLQTPPVRTTFVLSLYRAGGSLPFAALDGSIRTDPLQTTVVGWVHSSSGRQTAKSVLTGVSLPYLETFISSR